MNAVYSKTKPKTCTSQMHCAVIFRASYKAITSESIRRILTPIFYPIKTLGAPLIITDVPFVAMSPTLNAGLPAIRTVKLPTVNGPGTFPETGVPMSPTTAAGIPPINTVGVPAPVTTPSAVGSPILAAKLILINLNQSSFNRICT